ncbi:TolC family protein [Treponema sp.]|uniref:TolC family protein n=1 Tax=Treponema sp. TaxID=166 RepID=UPI00298E7098|nr:TolC family protein [Treponema sp.]
MKVMIKKFVLQVLAFSLLETMIFAEEEKSNVVNLTVDQAVEFALKNSNSMKSADIDLAMKERAGKYGWNVLLPSVNATATMNRSSSDSLESKGVPASMQTESLHWTGIVGVSASWSFSFAYIEQIRIAKKNYEVGQLSFEKSQREIKVNVQKLFYGLLLQQENLRLQKTSLENSRQRYIQAETNYKNGAVPEIRLLQAQVAYQNMKPTVSKLEKEFMASIDTFAFLIGYPVGTEIQLSGSINPEYIEADYDKLMNLYSSCNLDLQNLDKNIEIAKMGLTAANLGAYVPSLALNYSYTPMLTNFLDADKGGYPSGGDWKDLNGSFSLTLAWNLTNLLPFSANRQQAADTKATIQKLEVNRNMLLENQKINVRKAVNTLVDAREQIDVMSRNIGLAQRSYEMTARSYRNGTTELLDLRDAEDQLNKAKLGLANQKFNYISALLDLETELNVEFKKVSDEAETVETVNENKGE